MSVVHVSRFVCLAVVCLVGRPAAVWAQHEPVDLSDSISVLAVEVRDTMPPQLVVRVAGQASRAGLGMPRLEPLVPAAAPADGILEYRLAATPQAGDGLPAGSPVSATSSLANVCSELRWVRGVRIGSREAMLEAVDRQRIRTIRLFQGTSGSGQFEEALQDALNRMNEALGQSAVADGMATWELGPVRGRVGGFAGFNEVSVIVYVRRSPPWD